MPGRHSFASSHQPHSGLRMQAAQLSSLLQPNTFTNGAFPLSVSGAAPAANVTRSAPNSSHMPMADLPTPKSPILQKAIQLQMQKAR